MILPPLHSLVSVDWLDIVVDPNWRDIEKIAEVDAPHPANSLGYLSFIADDYIVISGTVARNGPDQYNNHISIPLGCIRNVSVLV